MMRPVEGWKTVKLGEVCDLLGGGTPRRSNSENFGNFIDWVTPSDLPPIGSVDVLGPAKEGLSQIGLSGSSAKRIPAGAVLFSSRASIGKIAVADREFSTNQGFANFVPHPDAVDAWFLAYLLRHRTADIVRLSGKTTYKEVSRSKLAAFEVSIPSLPEQRRIVPRIKECMERVEEIERLRNQAIAEAEAALPSALNETFVDLAFIYTDSPVEDIATETRYGTSRKCVTKPVGMPILRIPNVAGGFVNYDDLKYCHLDTKEMARIILQDGDLLFVRTNGSRELVGRCAIYERTGVGIDYGFASYLIRVRLDRDQVLPEYLAFFLNSTQGRVEIDKRRRTSAGQFNINSQNLRSIRFPVPALSVQRQVIDALQDRQAQILQLQQEMASAHQEELCLRESILRKAFAGEL